MDWSNDIVLQFIELLEEEPCIWNSKSKLNKNRNAVNDAWDRVKSKMTTPCTVEELKRKRNTLLTQYRECLKKIKDSTITGSGQDKIYQPSWFAFDAIHNYMGPLYNFRPKISNESQDSADENQLLHEQNLEECDLQHPHPRDSNVTRPLSRESNSRSDSDYFTAPKRQRSEQELLIVEKQMDEAYPLIKNRYEENGKETNECDLYGQLLAQKLKSLDVDDRLVLMNEIDNIVFKYIFNARKRTNLVRTGQTRLGERQHSPGPFVLIQADALQKNEEYPQSILSNYEMPFRTTIPLKTDPQESIQNKSHLSTRTSVAKINYDLDVASTSKDKYKKSKVNSKKNNILSQSVIYPGTYNIIDEVYTPSDDDQ